MNIINPYPFFIKTHLAYAATNAILGNISRLNKRCNLETKTQLELRKQQCIHTAKHDAIIRSFNNPIKRLRILRILKENIAMASVDSSQCLRREMKRYCLIPLRAAYVGRIKQRVNRLSTLQQNVIRRTAHNY